MEFKEQQIKNSLIYLLPLIVGNLFPFITLPIFTRILTKEDYGVLALAQIYAIIINGLANFGMRSAYQRNYFQYRTNQQDSSKLLYSILFFVILNFLFLISLTFVFKGTISKIIIGSVKHEEILFWAVCAQFSIGLSHYYLTYFKNSETAKKFVAYTIGNSLIYFIVSFFLVVYLRIGVIGIIYGQLSAGAIIFCLLTYKFIAFLKPSLSKRIFIESLKISYPLTPRIFLGVISTQFDKYMIGLLATVGGVGIYSIGQNFSYIIFNFTTSIQNVFSPQVFKKMFDMKDRGGRSIGKYLTPFVYISIFIALSIALFSEEVITIMTPPSFHGAIAITIILSMYYGFLIFGKLNSHQLLFMKKTYITSILTMLSIGINIGLNIPFILKWGAVGAACATLLAGLISGAISFAVAQYHYQIVWEYKKIGTIFLLFFLSSTLILILRESNISYPIRLCVKSISLAIYIIIGIKIMVLTKENCRIIKDMFFNIFTKERRYAKLLS